MKGTQRICGSSCEEAYKVDWKKLFSTSILNRGRDYYRSGNVVDYRESDRTIEAAVLGSRIYDVRITDPGAFNMRMKCSCPHARDGFNCKHMAAVLFLWEERKEEEETEPADGIKSIDDIIPPAEKGGEPFYHMSRILSGEKTTAKICREAKAYFENGNIVLEDIKKTPSYSGYSEEEDGASSEVTGYFDPDVSGYRYGMTVRITRTEVTSYRCDACGNRYDGHYYFYSRKDPMLCSHLMGLMIAADDVTKKVDPGDYTDRRAQRFLDAFMREKVHSASEERSPQYCTVRLEPRIVQNGSGFELNFRIGNSGKMYVVRNLTDLHRNVSGRKKMYLGKNNEIDFAAETFDEDSQELFELIEGEVRRMEAVEEKMQERRTYYYGGTLEAGKGIPFTGEAVDTVYEMMYGSHIDYKTYDSSKAERLLLGDTDPKVEVRIDVIKNRRGGRRAIDAVEVSGRIPAVIEGVRSKYYISDGRFSRLSEERWKNIKPFAEAAVDNRFDFMIGHNHASRFYYDILPGLRDDPSFVIDEASTAEGLIPEKAEFAFYMDAEDDIIICEPEVGYGTDTDRIRPLTDDQLPLAPYRDLYQEAPVASLMEELFDVFDPEREAYLLEDSDDARFDLLRNGIPRMMAYGEVNSTDAFSSIRIRRTPSVQIGVSVESDLLDLEIVTQDMSYDELAALLLSHRQKKRYHRLRNGEFVDLGENESLDTLMRLMERAGTDIKDFIKGKVQIPVYRALYLDKMLEGHEELVAGRDRHYRNLIRDFKTISDADFDTPAAMEGVLRPYQEYGYKWLRTLEKAGFGGILADDMGLGKTIQILALLQAYREESGLCALVVCPASVVYNWIDEIHRFTPELRAAALAGTRPQRKAILRDHGEYDILVTSYDLLKRDIDLYEEISFTHEILDEAQFIKNAKAIAAKSVKLIKASHRFALTGTPVENRLSELWSIFDYLMPGFLYNYERFRKTYELPISKYSDPAATESLRNMIAPFILRRKKKDVLKDLPDKIEEVRYARLEDEQRRLYDGQAVRISRLIEEKGDFNTGKIEILAELTRIRQICCDPNLIFDDYDGGSAKRQACIDLVRSAYEGGHKMLLFSQFTSMLELLEEDLRREGIDHYKLTGATSKEERMRLVKAFNSDDVPVFLISLKAGGTGLNLTGADIVIHYDPGWNLAAQDQATDRAHRIGQTKDVTVFRLIAKDTIEEKIVKLQETKKELADAVLSGETKSLGAMSKEELLALLS